MEQQKAFQSQGYAQLPLDHDFTCKGFACHLYLTLNNKSIGDLLAEEVKGIELPVYYLSKSLQVLKWIIL